MQSNFVPLTEENFRIFQIFYDERSRLALDNRFIPLDNIFNSRPDWYEFWVIRKFLLENALDPNVFYGFLSPKFAEKTGFGGSELFEVLLAISPDTDAILVTSHPEQILIHKNQFFQGEIVHPGLMEKSQCFFNTIGLSLNLNELITDLSNSVYSNYIIAKPNYWNKWLELANQFFEYSESRQYAPVFDVNSPTPYGMKSVQMKVFIQERFPSVILSTNNFNCCVPSRISQFGKFKASRRDFLCELARVKSMAVAKKTEGSIFEYEFVLRNFNYTKLRKYNFFFTIAGFGIPIVSKISEILLIKKLKKMRFNYELYAKQENIERLQKKNDIFRHFVRYGWKDKKYFELTY